MYFIVLEGENVPTNKFGWPTEAWGHKQIYFMSYTNFCKMAPVIGGQDLFLIEHM